MKHLLAPALLSALLLFGTPAPGQDTVPLWSIGSADDSTAEFALAPGGYRDYRTPACFVVGASTPEIDWPYVQPGPIDGGWAPGTPQTFEVWFGLGEVPTAACRLVLDFADTHAADPPRLAVQVNDARFEFATPAGAGDASVYGDPTAGRETVAQDTR